MASSFPHSIIQSAWDRQGALCAYCGKQLVRVNQDKGAIGAWHPHHRKPKIDGGTDTLQNCVILCINEPQNCHLMIGHGGDWGNYNQLKDSELPFLYAGRARGTTLRSPTATHRRKRRVARRSPQPTVGTIRPPRLTK